MSELSVWVLSWNCENDLPTKKQLEEHVVANELKGKKLAELPDVIVVGLQEARFKRVGADHFVAELLQQVLVDDQDARAYERVTSLHTKGASTKWPKKCVIQMGVLVKKGVELASVKKGVYQTSGKAKGGVCSVLTFEEPRVTLAFANCHLESKTVHGKSKKRNKQIVKVLDKIVDIAASDEKEKKKKKKKKKSKKDGLPKIADVARGLDHTVDVVFFFGDLNYRLYPSFDLPKGDDDEIDPKVVQAERIRLDIDPVELSKWCSTEWGREVLYNLDGLNNTTLVDDEGVPIGGQLLLHDPKHDEQPGFGFTFPAPMPKMFLPSYKLDYQTFPDASWKFKGGSNFKDESPVLKLDSSKEVVDHTLIADAYFRKRKKEKKPGHKKFRKKLDAKAKQHERPGAFDLGWLDRVGYRVSPRDEKFKVEVEVEAFKSYEQVRLSDHAPVVFQCKVKQPNVQPLRERNRRAVKPIKKKQ